MRAEQRATFLAAGAGQALGEVLSICVLKRQCRYCQTLFSPRLKLSGATGAPSLLRLAVAMLQTLTYSSISGPISNSGTLISRSSCRNVSV